MSWYLSDIFVSNSKKECVGYGKSCVDIEYESLDDVYIFEFVTFSGWLLALNCGVELELNYGKSRIGLKVPKSSHPERPPLGYYVLATRLPATARDLAAVFNSDCSVTPDNSYLARLSELVARPDVEWRALHLVNRRGSIREI